MEFENSSTAGSLTNRTAEEEDPALLDAQNRLEEKRKVLRLSPQSTGPKEEVLREISRIKAETGKSETCRIHWGNPLDDNGACDICREQLADVKSREQAARQQLVEKRLGSIKLGKRYANSSFDNFESVNEDAARVSATCRRYAETFPDRLDAGDCMLFLGNCGTGKNHLAAAICNHIVRAGHTALHTTAIRLVRRIKDTWRKDSTESEQDAVNAFTLPDCLVVDEIGVQFGTAAEMLLLFDVLNDRYTEQKPTILISNLNTDEIRAFLGIQLMDRFREGNSVVLEFTWDSYRGR